MRTVQGSGTLVIEFPAGHSRRFGVAAWSPGPRLNPDHVLDLSRAGQGGPPAPAQRRTPQLPSYLRDALEYEARGLLNLVVLATRCALGEGVTPEEKRRWHCEIEQANARLEEIYAAGLPRTFLSNPTPVR